MNQGNFFSELKRRNVYKVALAYGVSAWLLIEIASIVFPVFEMPAEIMKGLVVVVVGGSIVPLIMPWSVEVTPARMQRTEEISTTSRRGNSMPPECRQNTRAAATIT